MPGITPPPSDALEWLRRDAELVIGVNLLQLRATALWRAHLAPWLTTELAATVPAVRLACGLDLFAAFDTLTVALHRFDTTIEGDLVFHLAPGTDPGKLWTCLHAQRQALRADGIDPVWEPTRDGDILSLRTAHGNGAVLVAEKEGVLRGQIGVEVSSEELKKSAKKAPRLRGSPGFRELYSRLDSNASAWFLLRGPLLEPAAEEHVELRAITGTLTAAGDASAAGEGAGPDSVISLDARLHTTTSERAVRYADTANSRLAPTARAAFTHLTIAADRDDVHLTATLSAPQLLSLITRGTRLVELLVPAPAPAAP